MAKVAKFQNVDVKKEHQSQLELFPWLNKGSVEHWTRTLMALG